MKISSAIITGGSGFIGSHLLDRLVSDGTEKILLIDDLSTGLKSNIEHHLSNNNIKFIHERVEDIDNLTEITKGYDVCFHLAAGVGVKAIMENTSSALITNIEGTQKIISSCSKNKTPILIASTSEVYGVSEEKIWNEETRSLIGPPSVLRWSYAASKLIGEFLALSEHKDNNLKPVIVRLFNIIGPRQLGEYGMVVPKFIKLAQENKPLIIHGDGKQSRSFTWVGDVVDSFIKLIEGENYGEIYNIGHSEEVNIVDLAELIIKTNKSESEIQYTTHEEAYGKGFDDPVRRTPDITKIKKTIGYSPSISLEEMIIKISEYIKSS